MDALDLARWQFGITTVYHFLFVPLTIGLAFIVAGFQTAWVRTGNERWLRLTKFYGKLFLINFAMGVVTGIVQEFQFGMNWSDYSRFVGDVFGAPLALEGLLAFFLESTFLGLWIFGWDRLPKRVHLATIWAAACGTLLSAYFILAANSWMQWPVGFTLDPETGRAQLTDFWAVLTNEVALWTFPHTIAASFLTAGALVVAIALWHLVRRPKDSGGAETTTADTDTREVTAPTLNADDTAAFRSALRVGAAVCLVAGAVLALSGDQLAKVIAEVQPMKLAAAEGLDDTQAPAPFTVVDFRDLDGESLLRIQVPYVLSYLATGDVDGAVAGINDIQAEYVERYGPGEYMPVVPVTFWSFRLMIGLGMLAVLIAGWALWTTRRGGIPHSRWLMRVGLLLPLLPLAANSFGWIFTEMGRQPWAVFGLLPTAAAISPGTTVGEVATSLAIFTVLYGVLAVIEVRLLLMYARAGLPTTPPPSDADTTDDAEPGENQRPLAFAY